MQYRECYLYLHVVMFPRQSEILVKNRIFFHTPPAFYTPDRGPHQNVANIFRMEK